MWSFTTAYSCQWSQEFTLFLPLWQISAHAHVYIHMHLYTCKPGQVVHIHVHTCTCTCKYIHVVIFHSFWLLLPVLGFIYSFRGPFRGTVVSKKGAFSIL